VPQDEIAELAARYISRRNLLMGAGIAAGISVLGIQLANPSPASAVGTWGGYTNGNIPLSALALVGGVYLRPDAASSLTSMLSAYATAMGGPVAILEGYRDYARQVYLYDQYQNHGGNLAASPGTSNHGWGLAVDFGGDVHTQGTAGWNWVHQHGAAYGWWWAGGGFSQIEAWHWEYDGIYNGMQPGQNDEEDDVMYLRNSVTGQIAAFGAFSATGIYVFSTTTQISILRSVIATYNSVTGASIQLPPDPSNINNFVNIDATAWSVVTAVARGN